MEIYLVGGAVRDQLLGLPITERDYVVVGATPAEMLAHGYKPVGKEFPVFLHPKTHAEYALARTERKTGKGYKGFVFHTTPQVTLEEDLQRRDLTINAIAQTLDGQIIDPYHGQLDLKNKILRHVSPAFSEDPVRILRVARFATRFTDFQIHPETLRLMQQMVQRGEIEALVAERVWQEWNRALEQAEPARFVEVLADCGAWEILFPELDAIATKNILQKITRISALADIRFAALFSHIPENQAIQLCQRYHVGNAYQDLAVLVAKYAPEYAHALQATAQQLLNLFHHLDAFRRPQRLEKFLFACSTGISNANTIYQFLQNIYRACATITAEDFIARGFKKQEIGKAIDAARLVAIEKLQS